MIMNNLKKAMPHTWNYWNIQKPVRLIPQKKYDGVTITPKHNKVLKPVVEGEILVITPIHEESRGNQTITRAFGDLLEEEVN